VTRSFLGAALAAARKDLLRRLRDPMAFALWLGIPLVIGGLISLAMGGRSGPRPKALVLVVDRDDSFLSGALFQALSSERAQVFEAEKTDEAAGRARLLEGEASALLVIPAGFGAAVLEERPSQLQLVTNPAQRILPGMVKEALDMLCELVFYLHRVLGPELRTIVAGPPDGRDFFADARVAEISVAIQHRVQALSDVLFPPVIALERIQRADATRDEPQQSLGRLFFPSMLLMSLFFIAQGLADDVWREKSLGLLRRASIAPDRTLAWLAGKLLAAWLVMLAVALLAALFGAIVFDVDAGRSLLAALWASAVGVLLTLLMSALATLARSHRASGLVTNLVLFPMLMLGGSFFPFEAMPQWIRAIGRWTPNGWGMTVLKSILDAQASASSLAAAAGVLALATSALFFLCERRLSGAFARS
jgi:ABC-type Na+ efflux pump permease subunit